VADSPKFIQGPEKRQVPAVEPQLHIALVKLRAPQTLDKCTLDGVGRTLSQLNRLGMTSIVVVDCSNTTYDPNWRTVAIEQADRIVAAIGSHTYGEGGARFVDNGIGISELVNGADSFPDGQAYVTLRNLLMTPLRRGIIPVIPSMGYTEISQTSLPLHADDVVLALTREFVGLHPRCIPVEDGNTVQEHVGALQSEVSLDRLILLDPLGGIPSSDQENGYHVFLNMEQEYELAKSDLLKNGGEYYNENVLESHSPGSLTSGLGGSTHFFQFLETKFGGLQSSTKSHLHYPSTDNVNYNLTPHLQNLSLIRTVLSLLPSSSSALITTPAEAANSGREPDTPFQAAGVGTRRQRNPLIHNLLTDKPVFSSSLPIGRLGASNPKGEPPSPATTSIPTTFAKHGMPVTIFPDPKVSPWVPPELGKPQISLTDSQVDLTRLVHLIEDSFGRKLDVEDYLERVNDRIAGVIIAGNYEGGAILTWETPPGVINDGSPESRGRMVPYLDKFAVLKKSQGSGGTADVVFKAMVRDCFPLGVCWRSRKTNVVNKWYFERSRGTWKLPNTGWTMFWTTPDLSLNQQKFRDYEGVCKGIEPSWADNKAVLD
jgi:amino-acid N-acetyltransferase